MNNARHDYPQLLNRFSHVVVLSKTGKADAAVDHLTLTAFVLDPAFAPRIPGEITEALKRKYSFSLSTRLVDPSLARLVKNGLLKRESGTGIFRITPQARARIEAAIREAAQLEEAVRTEWVEAVAAAHPDLGTNAMAELWECLRLYMAQAFERHGLEAVRLLDASISDSTSASDTLPAFLARAIGEACANVPGEVAEQEIRRFFAEPTPSRTRYVAQLLDTTFTVFALSVDRATTEYLRESLPGLRLFADTNFLFDLLAVNLSPSADASRELIEAIQENKLPIRLYYHEATFDETRATIGALGDRLREQKWQQALSAVAPNYLQLNGLEQLYHRLNAEVPIDPDDFLTRFDHLETLLGEWGFAIFPARTTTLEDDHERGRLVMEYEAYLKEAAPDRIKPYSTRNHDITVWQAVQRERKHTGPAVKSGALFLTCDRTLYHFERERLVKPGRTGCVILPHQLLQVLRPFLPESAVLDERLVAAFAVPELRVAGTADEPTKRKIMAFLNSYGSYVKPETAVRILQDELLNAAVQKAGEEPGEVEAAIEQALLSENEQLIEEKIAAQGEARRNAELARERENQIEGERAAREQAEAEAIKQSLAAAEAEQRAQSVAEASRELERVKNQELEDERRVRELVEHRARRTQHLLVGTLAAVAIFAWFQLPHAYNWRWLIDHPARSGIQWLICASVVLATLAFIDRERRWAVWVVTAGAALVAALALFGR